MFGKGKKGGSPLMQRKSETNMDIGGEGKKLDGKLEGYLKKQAKKGLNDGIGKSIWQKRYFEQVAKNRIEYKKNPGEKVLGSFDPTQVVSLNIKAEPSSNLWVFEVALPNRVLPLQASSAEEMNYWVTGIGALKELDEGLEALPDAEKPEEEGGGESEDEIDEEAAEGEGEAQTSQGRPVTPPRSKSPTPNANRPPVPSRPSRPSRPARPSIQGSASFCGSVPNVSSSPAANSPTAVRRDPPPPVPKSGSSSDNLPPKRPLPPHARSEGSVYIEAPAGGGGEDESGVDRNPPDPGQRNAAITAALNKQKRLSSHEDRERKKLQFKKAPMKSLPAPPPNKPLPGPPGAAGSPTPSLASSAGCPSPSSSSPNRPPPAFRNSNLGQEAAKASSPALIRHDSFQQPKGEEGKPPAPKHLQRSVSHTPATLVRKGGGAPPTLITKDSPRGGGEEGGGDASAAAAAGGAMGLGDMKNLSHKTKVANEILETEREYVQRLKVIKNHFMEPLEKNAGQPNALCKPAEIKLLFSNVGLLLNIAEELLKLLEARMTIWDDGNEDTHVIGDVFIQMAPIFKIYSEYGTNYEKGSLQTLAALRDQSPDFDAFCVEQMRSAGLPGLTIDSMLITPIQRIPRYGLLLRDALKVTPEGHKDYGLLEQAIDKLKSVADFLNKDIGDGELRQRFLKLASEAKSLMKPNRRLLYDGELDVGNKVKIHLFLFNDLVIHMPTQKAKTKKNLVNEDYHWPSGLVWLGEGDNPNSFALIGPAHTYNINCPNAADKGKLVKKVNVMINETLSFMQSGATENKRYGEFSNFPAGGKYVGWWKDGWMDGEGKLSVHGCVYEGTFVNGSKNGKGKMKFISGAAYEGEWKDNCPHGHGVMLADSGSYTGEWKNGFRDGQGKCEYASGDVYEGAWVGNQPHGLGKLTQLNGVTYDGGFENGRMHGRGTLIDSKGGGRYEGMWSAGLMHGKGKLERGGGELYEGDFQFGLKHGAGTFIGKSVEYMGEWDSDMYEGQGKLTRFGDVLEGKFKKGRLHGQGNAKYSGSSVREYTGEWANGRWHGKGTLYHRNGDVYKGTFKNGLFHGEGRYTYASGFKEEGSWNQGKREGKYVGTPSGSKETMKGKMQDGASVKFANDGPTGAWSFLAPAGLPYFNVNDNPL